MIESVFNAFGNNLRVRVCGLLVVDGRLLMINHQGINDGDFWSPPGGGLQFGETIETCLKREFLEETGLNIQSKGFQFFGEFIKPPLHALELFFSVDARELNFKRGYDPEMLEMQIIQEVKFLTWAEINGISPESRHGIFNLVTESSKILDLKGHLML